MVKSEQENFIVPERFKKTLEDLYKLTPKDEGFKKAFENIDKRYRKKSRQNKLKSPMIRYAISYYVSYLKKKELENAKTEDNDSEEENL